MNIQNNDLAYQVTHWLAEFERMFAIMDMAALEHLFDDECYFRDVLALDWDIRTLVGKGEIRTALEDTPGRGVPRNIAYSTDRTPASRTELAGIDVVEALFEFETDVGRGAGVLRLKADPERYGPPKALSVFFALKELKGHEEALGPSRPAGAGAMRNFRGPNWLDQRNAEREFSDRDPAVLVVGSGQAGLCIAARLKQLGVDTLVVDREARVGDNWRNRYHALTLHNSVEINHLPYMPFPPNWPKYIAKDKLANWLESYAESMELNIWTESDFQGATFDEKTQSWTARIERADGTVREVKPRHVVMATGVSGIPNIPDIKTLENFGGPVIHAGAYRDGDDWAGKKAIIVGTGNSAHDIAQDLHSAGASVTMIQRNSTMVINVEPSAQLAYERYEQGLPLDDSDLLNISIPLPLTKRAHIGLTQIAKENDKPLLKKLEKVGFRLNFGEDETGWLFKYLTKGGGYYFNVGCSDLIADGKIEVVQHDEIHGFNAKGMSLDDGRQIDADLVVLATGYKDQEYLARTLFGDDVADRVGPVWGYGDGLELRNMFTRTNQPDLWFMAGSLAQCRVYSKYLGLQIKATEENMI